MKKFGYFNNELGSYTITQLPKIGNYEYILRNKNLLVKVDQFGPSTIQHFPPLGIVIFKRENREKTSPFRTYFQVGKELFHNFDVFRAKKITINYTPTKITYDLTFYSFQVKTELSISDEDPVLFYNITYKANKNVEIKILNLATYYLQDAVMAPWDKPEWYSKTSLKNNVFKAHRLSVNAKKDERHTLSLICNCKYDSATLSYERLIALTNNFSFIPDELEKKHKDVYGYEQCFASLIKQSLNKDEAKIIKYVFALDRENIKEYLNINKVKQSEIKTNNYFKNLFNVKNIKTSDNLFDSFVNGFLPMQLSWVTSLDRGWPTGMRGVRDAANDFQGYIDYDPSECKKVILNIIAHQRFDGWYPRQVGVADFNKNDLRPFMDNGLFFFEFFYRYINYTDDYKILSEKISYLDNAKKDSVITHLIKGINFYCEEKHIGEHGLIKLEGGDWLDCIYGAGLKGIGESTMVTCQVIMAIDKLIKILDHEDIEIDNSLVSFKNKLNENLNRYALNKCNFYNGYFTDRRKWLLSDKDEDGIKRVYAPANAYAILSGVAKGKEDLVIKNIDTLKSDEGYRLFSYPLGEKEIEGIGKIGSGDFSPYFNENGSIYSHGSTCFYAFALAKVGDYKKLEVALKFLLPYLRDEEKILSGPYAITNCYQLIPSFKGRTAFSFLTGTVSMLELIIYELIFGIKYDFEKFIIEPCLIKSLQNSEVNFTYKNKKICIKYIGYGNKIKSYVLNGKLYKNNSFSIDKKSLPNDCIIEINLSAN